MKMEFYCVLFLFFYSMQALHAGPPVDVTPKNIILLENKPLEVKCRAGIPLTYCRFVIPGFKDGFNLRPTIGPFKGVEYAGAGLDKGECGMLIKNVKAMHSGTIQCTLGFEKEATESTGNITLIVAKAPDPPFLQVLPGLRVKDAFQEGEHIHANCRISNARPVANISWYLGSERIYDGLSSTLEEENDNLITISQNLTRKVTYMDHDKDLKCVASHIALGEGSINHSIHKISVLFPPKPKSQELEKFGFIIGKPGKIVVTFQANPRPDITWKVDQDVLKQGDRDRTGRFQAAILQQKAGGTWDAVLNIGTVRAEEVEKRYTLIATNNLGQESYKVAISTSPEPPGDITAGAIVGIVIAVLVILLLVFILIFARATGKWCFAGGAPRPVGESTLTFGSFLRRETEKYPRKVNSLIYEYYTLVRKEDGIKSYVSPEEKYQILLRKKIKAEDEKINLENEKKRRKSKEIDSDSDSGYEIPIEPDLKPKPKSCNDLNLMTSAKYSRKNSFPLSEVEFYVEENEKINLPFYMTSLENNAIEPEPLTTCNKKKKKNKNRAVSNGDDENEQKSDEDSSSSTINDKEDKKGNKKSGFSLRNSFGLRGKNRKLKEEEEEGGRKEKNANDELIMESNEKYLKSKTKRFSLPRSNRSPLERQNVEDENTNGSDDSQTKNSKQFSLKLPKLSWRKKKKSQEDSLNDEKNEIKRENETEKPNKPETSSDEKRVKENDWSWIWREGIENPSNSYLSSCEDDNSSKEEKDEEEAEDEEVFFKEKAPEKFIIDISNELERTEADEQTTKTNYLKNRYAPIKFTRGPPIDLLKTKSRKLRNGGKIDPNPLKKMFGIRRPLKMDSEEKNSEISEKRPEDDKSSNENFQKEVKFDGVFSGYDSEVPVECLEQKEISYRDYKFWVDEPETDVQTNQLSCKITKTNFLTLTVQSDGSDTESADHGSADKSSMSKLTNEKQPKKLMSGLFGSFAKGKNKDRSKDNEFVRNTSSFEVTIKEQPDDVPAEETRTEGIVYAELDMARSPGNVMRREDEKTEYAEIIYPTSKMSPEKVKEELRKSRENLASSRENLAEADDTCVTTMTPDGKKEAAV